MATGGSTRRNAFRSSQTSAASRKVRRASSGERCAASGRATNPTSSGSARRPVVDPAVPRSAGASTGSPSSPPVRATAPPADVASGRDPGAGRGGSPNRSNRIRHETAFTTEDASFGAAGSRTRPRKVSLRTVRSSGATCRTVRSKEASGPWSTSTRSRSPQRPGSSRAVPPTGPAAVIRTRGFPRDSRTTPAATGVPAAVRTIQARRPPLWKN